jgi:hypothetical protein
MADSTDHPGEFYRRPDKLDESICMLCYLPIQATKPEFLKEAENIHRTLCPARVFRQS